MKFKHASREDRARLADNRSVRHLRGAMREIAGTGPQSLWLRLQEKYPWPWPERSTDHAIGALRAHSEFLRAAEGRIRRMHRSYRAKRR